MKKMWQELRQVLGGDAGEDLEDDQGAQYAAAALMIEMCEADLQTDPQELEAVAASLRAVFALDEAEVERLIRQASDNNQADISYFPHVERVNELCGPEEKRSIVECLWRVAAADGRVDKYEEHYLRRLCELIHVPHRVFIQARHLVLGE
ncbi:MAG: TerB family tellurite resistance protein [Xanthomonadales bacterium]|nr:TerB family tellurite resistance protein [Xanthomonadales bacterium]